MDLLNWIQNWYRDHCTDEWYDYYGIKIDTLDNPGWVVKIDLAETSLENKPFSKVEKDNGDNEWLFCKVENHMFQGFGDPSKLTEILEVFRQWVNSEDSEREPAMKL